MTGTAKITQLVLNVGAVLFALLAAREWYYASRWQVFKNPDPRHFLKPATGKTPMIYDIEDVVEVGRLSSQMNAKAAGLAAVSALLQGAAVLAGMFS